MTETAKNLPEQASHRPQRSSTDSPAAPALASRFGEAAHLLDALDLRPFDKRQPSRPWWRLW